MTRTFDLAGGDPRSDRNIYLRPENAREEIGRVVETGDGIARVEGLHSAMANELLEFEAACSVWR